MQEDIKKEVMSSWVSEKNPLGDYQKALIDNSNAFKKIRYVYEGKIHYNFEFLRVLNDVLIALYEK